MHIELIKSIVSYVAVADLKPTIESARVACPDAIAAIRKGDRIFTL
jgi:hypothetical protein